MLLTAPMVMVPPSKPPVACSSVVLEVASPVAPQAESTSAVARPSTAMSVMTSASLLITMESP